MTSARHSFPAFQNVFPAREKHRDLNMSISTGKFSQSTTFRKVFARKWSEFIRENFHCPKQVSKAFGVDRTTSENWWEGRNAPQGWVVGLALTDPELGHSATKHITGVQE